MKIKLESIGYWNIAERTDIDSKYVGHNQMIQAMKDLYPLVKEHLLVEDIDRFEKAKNVPLCDAFEFFLEAIDNGLNEHDILYEIYKDCDNIFRIRLYNYPKIINEYQVYWMPMIWLPAMKANNPKYFDLIYTIYALMSKTKGILIYADNTYDNYQERIIEEELSNDAFDIENSENKQIVEELKILRKNRDIIEYPKPKMTFKRLKEQVKKMIPKSNAEKIFKTWLKKGIKVLETYGNMDEVTSIAEKTFCILYDIEQDKNGNYDYPDGQPVFPCEILRFTAFSNKTVSNWNIDSISEQADNFGEAEYCFSKDVHTINDLYNVITSKEDMSSFINNLASFFEFGYSNYDEIISLSKKIETKN